MGHTPSPVRYSEWSALTEASPSLTIPCGEHVLLDENLTLAVLRVEGTLSFIDDGTPLEIRSDFIYVCGELLAGSPEHPHMSPLAFTLTGVSDYGFGSKAMVVEGGFVKLYGSSCKTPSWSTLSQTVVPGERTLRLTDEVEWKVGTQLMVASTDYSPLQTEVNTVVSATSANGSSTVTLAAPLRWPHAGVAPITAEVAVLTRNIVVRGEMGCDTFPNDLAADKPMCGHFMISHTPRGIICGVEFSRLGQHSTTGRYPLHLHMCGETTKHPDGPIQLLHNSVRDNHHRGIVIHGTSGSIIRNNVLFRTKGHLMLTEDGAEEGNKIVDNVFALPNPIKWRCTDALDAIGAVRRGNNAYTKRDGQITGTCEAHRCSHGTGELANICGNRHDDTANAIWLSNPSNFVVGNRAIGTPNDAAFRYEIRGLTGISHGISREIHGVSQFHKSKPMGPKGAFRNNVAHSCNIGMKNYPNWSPSIGVRIEGFTAWKNAIGVTAKTSLQYKHPEDATFTDCEVPSTDKEKAIQDVTETIQCFKRYTLSNATLLLNGQAFTTINGAKAHVVHSTIAPLAPASGSYIAPDGSTYDYADVQADSVALAGACTELAQSRGRAQPAVCRFNMGKHSPWGMQWLTAEQVQASICSTGSCTAADWYGVRHWRQNGKRVLLPLPHGSAKHCTNTHQQQLHGADEWDSMRGDYPVEHTRCSSARVGHFSRFPAASMPAETSGYFTAFREAKHGHQVQTNWAITADKYTIDGAKAAGFWRFEQRMTHGDTGLAGMGASLGSYNKGYVLYGERLSNRYSRALDDPEWDKDLGMVTPSMEMPDKDGTFDTRAPTTAPPRGTRAPTTASTRRPTREPTAKPSEDDEEDGNVITMAPSAPPTQAATQETTSPPEQKPTDRTSAV